MQIKAIKVYQVTLPFVHPYHLSGGRLDYVDTGDGVIAGAAPGLGVEPIANALGAPVAEYR